MTEIKEVKRVTRKPRKEKYNLPGLFAGWIDEKHRVAWAVSPHREDRRTGPVERKLMSSYAKELYATMTLGLPLPGICHSPVEEGAGPIELDSAYTLEYTESLGQLRFRKTYMFEAKHNDIAWKIANKFMEDRLVTYAAMKKAILRVGDLELRNPLLVRRS